MRQQGWGESSDGKAGRRWSEHRKYPTDREWLKTQDTIKGDRTKGQTLGSKNDTRAKKNQTWPRRVENEPDKTGSGGKDRKQPRKEDPGSGPSITIWLPQPRKKRNSQNKTESEKVTLGNGLRQRKAILPENTHLSENRYTASGHDKYLDPQWKRCDLDDWRHIRSGLLPKNKTAWKTRAETQRISPLQSNLPQSPEWMSWLGPEGTDRKWPVG